jgi:formate-dependent nitrite reductase membrane component NrfD
MALRELPVVQPVVPQSSDGHVGSAHRRPRDAYRDVPILQKPTWHHLIAAYFYSGGISSGSFVLGSLTSIVAPEQLRTTARTAHYVSFATMLPCPVFLILDLGKPHLFYHMLRIFKPSSPMNLGSWVLTVHGGFATLLTLGELAHEFDIPVVGPMLRLVPERAAVAAGLPTGLTLGGYTGVLIGTTSVPIWYTSPLLGALFMASAMSTGTAAVTLAGTLTSRSSEQEHRIVAPAAMLMGCTEVALLGGYLATSGEAAKPLLRSREGAQIAGAAALIMAGITLDLASMRARRGNEVLSALAASATLAGGALLRWGIVFAGRRAADDREGTLRAMAPGRNRPGWGIWRGRS